MKALIVILLLVAAGYSGYKYYSDKQAEEERIAHEAEQKRKEEVVKQEVAVAQYGKKKVTCSACNGEKIVLNRGSNGASTRQNCPVCQATGFREFEIPKGKKLCPDCKGMGAAIQSDLGGTLRSATLTEGFKQKITCVRCAGEGAVFAAPPKK